MVKRLTKAQRDAKEKKEKRPVGRPPKYTDEYIEREAEALNEWFKNPENIFFVDFVAEREYGPDYISAFANANKIFREACAKAKLRQQSYLMKGGLTRKFDSSFCRFTMQNVCGWSDKHTVVQETGTNAIDPTALNTSGDLVDDPTS